jgi:hypothetical protein
MATKGHPDPFDRQIGPPKTAEIFTPFIPSENPPDSPRRPTSMIVTTNDICYVNKCEKTKKHH